MTARPDTPSAHAFDRSALFLRRAAANAASTRHQLSNPAGVELDVVRQPQPESSGGVVGSAPRPDAPERMPALPFGLLPAAAPALPDDPPMPAALGAPPRVPLPALLGMPPCAAAFLPALDVALEPPVPP